MHIQHRDSYLVEEAGVEVEEDSQMVEELEEGSHLVEEGSHMGVGAEEDSLLVVVAVVGVEDSHLGEEGEEGGIDFSRVNTNGQLQTPIKTEEEALHRCLLVMSCRLNIKFCHIWFPLSNMNYPSANHLKLTHKVRYHFGLTTLAKNKETYLFPQRTRGSEGMAAS